MVNKYGQVDDYALAEVRDGDDGGTWLTCIADLEGEKKLRRGDSYVARRRIIGPAPGQSPEPDR